MTYKLNATIRIEAPQPQDFQYVYAHRTLLSFRFVCWTDLNVCPYFSAVLMPPASVGGVGRTYCFSSSGISPRPVVRWISRVTCIEQNFGPHMEQNSAVLK